MFYLFCCRCTPSLVTQVIQSEVAVACAVGVPFHNRRSGKNTKLTVINLNDCCAHVMVKRPTIWSCLLFMLSKLRLFMILGRQRVKWNILWTEWKFLMTVAAGKFQEIIFDQNRVELHGKAVPLADDLGNAHKSNIYLRQQRKVYFLNVCLCWK